MSKNRKAMTDHEIMNEFLDMPAAVGEDITLREKMLMSILLKAADGDMRAAEIVLGIMLEKE